MSVIQTTPANIESTQQKKKLKIETSLYDSQGSDQLTPPSQIWYQYSEPHIKTPTHDKFPVRNISQHLQFSNNLYRQAGASEFTDGPEVEHSKNSMNGNETGLVESKQKHVRKQKLQFISELSLPQNQKNEILTRKEQDRKQKQNEDIFGYGARQSSVNSKSSYEDRDINANKRRFVLDQAKKQQKSDKQGHVCAACAIM